MAKLNDKERQMVLLARDHGYNYGYSEAVANIIKKVQALHDSKYDLLVHMWSDGSTMYDRVLQASKILQLEDVLKMLESMK